MNTNDITTERRDNRALSLTAFILYLVGFLVLFLAMAFPRYPLADALILGAYGAEILALVFGLICWQQKLGKIAAIGAGLICIVGVIAFTLLFRK